MSESYGYLLIKAIITLGGVLCVMGLILYAMKRFMNSSSAKGPGAQPIRVLATSYLGPKKNLAIVEVAGEVLVLGVTPASINCLTRVEDREKIDELKKLKSGSGTLLSLIQMNGR